MKKTGIVAILLVVLMTGIGWAQKPVVAILNISPTTKPVVGQSVTLDASKSLIQGVTGVVNYQWYINGRLVGVGRQIPLVFEAEGLCRVELRITVDGQVQDTIQRSVAVKQTVEKYSRQLEEFRRKPTRRRRLSANERAMYFLPLLLYVLWLAKGCP